MTLFLCNLLDKAVLFFFHVSCVYISLFASGQENASLGILPLFTDSYLLLAFFFF